MQHTWRWFGPIDPVSLADIRQAGATGIVSALHHISIGDLWPADEVAQRKLEIESAGLEWTVVESIPVHESIKIGNSDAKRFTDIFIENLKTVAQFGIKTVCYNFMPVVDWTRTNLSMEMPTGVKALGFDIVEFAAFDLFILNRTGATTNYERRVVELAEKRFGTWSGADVDRVEKTIIAGLPGAELHHDRASFSSLLSAYEGLKPDQLRQHLRTFVKTVAPVAHDLGVNLAIHPDDPPFELFGLPRVVSTPADILWVMNSCDLPENGITFCTGSLGAGVEKDIVGWFRSVAHRVNFLHLRNVSCSEYGSFYEAEHLEGDVDMVRLIDAVLAQEKERGAPIPMRPDHGHLFERDAASSSNPGYSYLGRMRGLAELRGVERALGSI